MTDVKVSGPWWTKFIVQTGSLGVLIFVLYGVFVLVKDMQDHVVTTMNSMVVEMQIISSAVKDMAEEVKQSRRTDDK